MGRTGTFICLHSELERLKTEGLVDLFQAVKSARIQRAGLVPDAVRHMHWPSHCSVFSVTALYTIIIMHLMIIIVLCSALTGPLCVLPGGASQLCGQL